MPLWVNLYLVSTFAFMFSQVKSLKYDESDGTSVLQNNSSSKCNISCEAMIAEEIDPCLKTCLFKENASYLDYGNKKNYIYNPSSLCQTADKLEIIAVLYWSLRNNDSIESKLINFVIDVENVNLQEQKETFQIGIINNTIISIALKPYQDYRFNVTAVTKDGAIDVAESKWFRTKKDDSLAAPGFLVVHNQLQSTGKFVQIDISWLDFNLTDAPCFYNIYCLAVNSTSAAYVEKFVRNPEELLKPIVVGGLSYSTVYDIRISATNFDNSQESEYSSFFVKTKSCLELNYNSFNVCGPPKPKNLLAKLLFDQTMSITWDPPKYISRNNIVNQYKVDISTDFHSGSKDQTPEVHFVDGNTSCFKFTLNEQQHYSSLKISVSALSQGGISDSVHYIYLHNKQGTMINRTGIIAISMVIFCLIPVAVLMYFLLRKKLNARSIFLSTTAASRSKDNWVSPLKKKLLNECPYQIDINLVCLKDSLGTGAFGVVYEGTAMIRGVEEKVAVKMLKENASEEAQKCLLEEIEMLKFLGHHPHIVTLRAYVINGPVLALLVEFCPLGDLKNYLDKIKNKELKSTLMNYDESGFGSMNSWSVQDSPQDSFLSDTGSEVSNPSYFSEVEDEEPTKIWDHFYKKFISFSRQIAIGMEFLASNKIIHRDLAARNILLLTLDQVKITDFGLSKDIYENGIYCKKTDGGMLPVKWMAIESIFSQTYTSKSDVWSFGILLWEIFSIGGTPYPGISNREVISLIQTGYRMGKPDYVPDEIFDVMKTCWNENANSRPSFTNLKLLIENILESFETYDNVIY